MSDPAYTFASPEPPPQDQSLKDVVLRVVDTGRAYAEAEFDRQKVRAAYVGAGLRTIALLVTVALILLFGVLVTLMVGLIIALSPLLTPLGATAVVAGGALAIIALLLWLALRRWKLLLREPSE